MMVEMHCTWLHVSWRVGNNSSDTFGGKQDEEKIVSEERREA